MVSEQTKLVIERAKTLYEEKLRDDLEAEHQDRFVAIEPDSGEYFLGDSFDAAVRAARAKYATRLTHTVRIGHPTAFHIGLLER
jgi:hypothetical protein